MARVGPQRHRRNKMNQVKHSMLCLFSFFSSGATALQGFGRQSGRRRSAKLVPTFADRGVCSVSQSKINMGRNGSLLNTTGMRKLMVG